jgi:dephospho-CoA kinase
MIVIVTVGMPGAGKEEFLNVAKKFGFVPIRMGDIVREETRKMSLAETPENVANVAAQRREQHGLGYWATLVVPKVTEKKTIIDGTRGDAEVNIFRHNFGDKLVTIGIHASPDTRYSRIMARARGDDEYTLEKCILRDQRELKWGLGSALAMVDYMLINEGTLEEFRQNAEKLIKKILEEHGL